MSPHDTSFKNCFIMPSFFDPRQMMAAFGSSSKPTLMTERLSSIKTGDHPSPLIWTSSPSAPITFGIDGPHKSASMTPTCTSSSLANAHDKFAVQVLFPTPPLPERTNILCFTSFRFSAIFFRSGSGGLGFPDLQNSWFGQPYVVCVCVCVCTRARVCAAYMHITDACWCVQRTSQTRVGVCSVHHRRVLVCAAYITDACWCLQRTSQTRVGVCSVHHRRCKIEKDAVCQAVQYTAHAHLRALLYREGERVEACTRKRRSALEQQSKTCMSRMEYILKDKTARRKQRCLLAAVE